MSGWERGGLIAATLLVVVMTIWCVWQMIRNARGRRAALMMRLPDGREMDAEQARIIGSHHWGAATLVKYDPARYEHDMWCLQCQQKILLHQFFWETPLLETRGLSFQICMSCQPGDGRFTHVS